MIDRDSVSRIGSVSKTHGIRGEMLMLLDVDVNPADLRCLIFDIDGILVPFFVNSSRPRGTSDWLVTIDGVSNEKEAEEFVNHEIYALDEELGEEDRDDDGTLYLDSLIGYTLKDTDGTVVGEITDFNDATDNYLFDVTRPDGSSVLVPAVGELITDIDEDKRILEMDIPSGIY